MQDAQAVLQTIAKKCIATIGEAIDVEACGGKDFRKFVWTMEVKAFAEERLQRLNASLMEFLQRVEKATSSGKGTEAIGVTGSEELEQTVLQVRCGRRFQRRLRIPIQVCMYAASGLRSAVIGVGSNKRNGEIVATSTWE